MHIHHLLKDRLKCGVPTTLVQVGAHDGVRGDPVHDILIRSDWPALLVEPVAESFAKLARTYHGRPDIRLANVAIAGHDGEIDMLRISPEAIARGALPNWAEEAASLYLDRTALHRPDIAPHVIRERVACMQLPTLLQTYDIGQIDVLQIDAEGHDYHILRQLDFTQYQPAIINVEYVNLPGSEQAELKALLKRHGYSYEKTGYDLVAVTGT